MDDNEIEHWLFREELSVQREAEERGFSELADKSRAMQRRLVKDIVTKGL